MSVFVLCVKIPCILSKKLVLLHKACKDGKNKSRNGGIHSPSCQFHKSKEQNHVEKMERI